MKVTFKTSKQVLCTCDIKIFPDHYDENLRNFTMITIDGRNYSVKETCHDIKIDTFTQKCVESFTVFLE